MLALTAINHDGPVRVRELGRSGQGLVWVVQPEDFETVIDHINTYGGPAFWSVTPI